MLHPRGWRRHRFHPKLDRMAQPRGQIAASVPATTLFSVVLFTVIAAALAISIDLKPVSEVFRIAG